MDTALPGHALHTRFLRGLWAAPGAEAIRVGEEALTYETAHERALLWAGALLDASPEPPRAVGVLAGKGPTAYVGVLAALYAGAAVVPLQPEFPVARTRRMMTAAGVAALVVDGRGRALLPGLLDEDGRCDTAPTPGDGRDAAVPTGREGGGPHPLPAFGNGPPVTLLAPADDSVPRSVALPAPLSVAADDPAYVLFTSGSTGRPKGVPITHGNTAHYFRVLDGRYDFTPADVFSHTFDLVFDCAMFDLFSAWGAGAHVVAVPPGAYRDLPSFAAEQGLTVWFSTPSSIALVRRLGGLAPGALPTLRRSLFAGEALGCRDAADWQRAAPGSTVENLYGPTELTITISSHRWDPDRSPGLGAHGGVPIGAVHPGHQHLLLGADGLPCDGDEGELCLSGPQLTPGYLDPEDDAGRFLRHDGRAWYRTGDRVRLHEGGELAYLGRVDAQVQVQGWRVELAEIDHALSACPGVDQAVAVDVSHEGTTELVAFYTGTPTPPAELARGLRAVLPEKLVPRRFEHLGTLPLNTNRKIDRSALRSRASAPVSAHRSRTGAQGAVKPLVHDLLDRAAAEVPHACAVQDASRTWSYEQLVRLSHAFARWLCDQGVAPGDRVVTQIPSTGETVALFYGTSRSGAVFVPLNPGMRPFQLRSVLANCEPRLVIADGVAETDVRGLTDVPVHSLHDVWRAVTELAAGGVETTEEVIRPDDVAVLVYTSGSTAAPKAVICPHDRMTFASDAIQRVLGYRSDDVVFCRFPISWDYGLYKVLLCALGRSRLVLADGDSDLVLLKRMRETGATVVPLVPSLASMIVTLAARDTEPAPPVRLFTNTGAALPQPLIDTLRAAFPGARVVRQYGQTECKRVSAVPPEREHERPDSVGLPLPGTRVLILDADGQPVPAGHTGEIVAAGPHVMPGYWRAPEITERTFRRDPANGELRLHTGDYGHLDEDGFLYFDGRRDDMFKRKGIRMSTVEIEAAAADVPGVRAAAVLPATDARDMVLFVDTDLAPHHVLRELAGRLELAKVPSVCRVLADWPLSAHGKTDKKQLAHLVDGEDQ